MTPDELKQIKLIWDLLDEALEEAKPKGNVFAWRKVQKAQDMLDTLTFVQRDQEMCDRFLRELDAKPDRKR
jgi:hypothetical protein